MKTNVDLINGSIAGALTRLALPIMATSFLQMAYNLTDMIWIGKVGSDAVAAVGVAGMFIWLSNGIVMIPRIGGQVKVGQSLGAEKEMEAASYAKSAFQVAITLGVLYGVLCFCFHHGLVEFFQMDNQQIVQDAEQYLMVTCGLVTISFMNQIFTGTWTAIGNSTVTLRATLIGLSINLILDPVLIFGIGPFPELGILGAAIATVFAQLIVFVVFCVVSRREKTVFTNMNQAFQVDWNKVKSILQVGFPAGFQNMMFTGISMIVARMITSFGDAAIAVQKVGIQIESISWMTAEGFGTAVNALIAQNHGAKQENRVDKGYRTAIIIMGAWGILTSFVLIVFPEPLFRIFIQEENVVPLGIDYLRIVGYSQLFLCMELATAGAFQGLGKTLPPSISGITFTVIRIPLAYALSQTSLGLNGIWWAITISAIAKGVVLPIWFLKHRHNSKRCNV